MRWKVKPEPKLREQRTIKKFAWFRVRVGDQYVWLESYLEIQEYQRLHHYEFGYFDTWVTLSKRLPE